MRSNHLIGMAALLSLTTLVACSQAEKPQPALASGKPTVTHKGGQGQAGQTVPGSYIVQASGDAAAAIRHIFAQYGVVMVNPIGNGRYEIRLEHDPGLDALKSSVEGSNGAVTTIQPNFVYRAF